MYSFKKITYDEIAVIKPYMGHEFNTCDYSLGGIILWAEFLDMEYAIKDNVLYTRGKDINGKYKYAYSVPLTLSGETSFIDELYEYHKKNCEGAFLISFIPEKALDNRFHSKEKEAEKMEGWADYLYDAEKLAYLQGKSLQKKRNHLNHFKNTFKNYTFEEITQEDIPYINSFLDEYKSTHQRVADIEEFEFEMNKKALLYIKELEFIGYVLRVDGVIVAITIGEILNDTLFVHVEKANVAYGGVYQAINSFFAERMIKDYNIKYINREDDGNDLGIRKAKLSYDPLTLLEKYKIVFGEYEFLH